MYGHVEGLWQSAKGPTRRRRRATEMRALSEMMRDRYTVVAVRQRFKQTEVLRQTFSGKNHPFELRKNLLPCLRL